MLVIEPPVFGSEAVIVRVIKVPVVAEVADSVKLTFGGFLDVMVLLAEELFVVEPELSVAFT
jgi:hypothetical protein